ncbi:uncharacterized protein LOC132054455 [Lycium ferocissimum]|uniref:uncharacterized protein LOC132054455 n=1 Tax=Lycium ferocissimum TaxID=112874 RepID=UPI00281533B6|nr:uncharacterized protein LOC132054455 [Lycium ferocissimum]
MQLSIFSSGVNKILLKKIPNHPIGILNLFSVCLFLILSAPQIQGMRVHPVSLKRNISLREKINSNNVSSTNSEQQQQFPSKLRRLPHVFNNVLELPFRYDADVAVEEKEGFFCFVAKIELQGTGANPTQVKAQAVEIHPGVTKIVVTNGKGDSEDEITLLLEQLNVDTWRYRLPASTMPELATAAFVDGQLIVTVPKGGRGRREFDDKSRGVWGGGGRLVLGR